MKYWRKKARNMKLEVKVMRVREVIEKGCNKHESATKSNESKRVIREGKQGT